MRQVEVGRVVTNPILSAVRNSMRECRLACLLLVGVLACNHASLASANEPGALQTIGAHAERIRPYEDNPYYWQYKGEPILLFGGSWQDNLFNHPTNLEAHLDLLVSVGGNYVRNTMSRRNKGNIFPFERNEEGLFDLERFNEAYWERFENFLRLTHERDIIVQIEIWDPHDHYQDREAYGGWSRSPYNPVNNINYTADDTGLQTEITYRVQPRPTEHAFWRTVPALQNNERVLTYQMAFVDRMLEHALPYPHVLYCMNNEIGELTEWGDFWARHVQRRAAEAGVVVFTADMRRDHNIRTEDHHRIYDNPELYTFLDISQVTGDGGQRHYDDIVYVRDHIARHPRPINNVKNYGAAKQNEHESVARAFRFIFAGGASTRFHRPYPIEDPARHQESANWGLGLGPRAQTVIRAIRAFSDDFDMFRSKPRNDLLFERASNEAYLLAAAGAQYAVYFPAAGSVRLDLTDASGAFVVRRLDVDTVEWREEGVVSGGGTIFLTAPLPSDPHDALADREDLIVNGSFERSDVPAAPGYTHSVAGWETDVSHGHLINGIGGPFYTAALGPIPDGKQLYGKQGTGRLLQRVRGLQDGQPFTFRVQVNCREGNEGMDLSIRLGTHRLWHGTVTPRLGQFWEIVHEGVYDAAWGNELAFEFSNPLGDATLLLDDVQLVSVPGFGEHCIVVISKKGL